jgi:hypothetical protein
MKFPLALALSALMGGAVVYAATCWLSVSVQDYARIAAHQEPQVALLQKITTPTQVASLPNSVSCEQEYGANAAYCK